MLIFFNKGISRFANTAAGKRINTAWEMVADKYKGIRGGEDKES